MVVCQDLSLPQQAVQACHACISAGRDLIRIQEPYLALLTVPTRYDLIAMSAKLHKAGIAHRVFREEDLDGRPTALATRPVSKKERKHFRKLPLYAGAVSLIGQNTSPEKVA